MVRKEKKALKINLISLGCSKNLVDTEVLMGQLKASNTEVMYEQPFDKAETVVINTCGFIQDAKQESIDTILKAVEAKEDGYVKKIYVMGCLSQRYKEELKKEIPEVDGFFGVKDLPVILRTLGIEYHKELLGERVITTPSHSAYLKIAEGCDRKCSFCAIPIIRGENISRPIEELTAEASYLASIGVKEINLIAQDLTYYGLDLYRERKLAELMQKISDVKGIEWIRLHYTYPAGFPLEILDVMRDNPKICKYIDIPFQHINNDLLKSMRRNITSGETMDLVQNLRNRVPGVALRTAFIVGYPGETGEAFEELKQFVAKARFDRAGVFTYSQEEGTKASELVDDVPEEVKLQRADELMALQEKISAELNQGKVGKKFKVLFDREEGDYFVGRTEIDSPEIDNEVLVLKTEPGIRIGEFATILITSSESFDLFGIPATEN
ncbi:MAG: 30S ribosomal protein S12 methylthiotransferase RimO [Bacteroidota bacterium]|nr:30S ribosomal protein S12 methylthiotransferase RimO [Bacteroidota bacterium]